MRADSETICAMQGWTEKQLLEILGDGPYVIYGGSEKPPPEGYTIGGVPVVHDPSLPFNCTRVARAT